MVEICCDPNSKLSEVSREPAEGCRVIQFTEKDNLLDEHYRYYVADVVNKFPKTFYGEPAVHGGHTTVLCQLEDP